MLPLEYTYLYKDAGSDLYKKRVLKEITAVSVAHRLNHNNLDVTQEMYMCLEV